MTVGRRARGLTIGSKPRPLVELSKGRGSPDHWVKPRAVPSSRRFMPSCAHAVPKEYEVVIPDHCIPVPVPKRALNVTAGPAAQVLRVALCIRPAAGWLDLSGRNTGPAEDVGSMELEVAHVLPG
jgi:hypothetical protein